MENSTTMSSSSTGCCAPFDPTPWQGKEFSWDNKPFVQDHVREFMHVPLNMGKRMLRNQEMIDAAGASPAVPLMLVDEHSPWGSDLFIDVTGPVPGAHMAYLSGDFVCRVFEGPYKDIPKWMDEMNQWVAASGRTVEKLYFSYPLCPACAKAYGKNHVMLFAKVGPNASAVPQ